MSKMKRKIAMLVIMFLVVNTLSSSFVLGQSFGLGGGSTIGSTGGTSFSGSSSRAFSSSSFARPGFQTFYSAQQRTTYWPVLGDPLTCQAREDILLQVAPAGCQPAVVRSDLLAEQDVPVFCQIDSVKVNPLIDISQIRNMRFVGQYPPEIVGSGFHPARAALRTYDTLLGAPLVNNVGYAVVVLRRQPNEALLPDSVNVTLQAQLDYVSGNAYGVGRVEFILEQTSDAEWESEKLKQSFWNGRYFVRLEQVDEDFADVSIYHGDQRAVTTRVERGGTSERIFVPGLFCRAGLQVSYDNFVSAEEKARIEVSSVDGFDVFDVQEGSRFLDNRCVVRDIRVDEDGEAGLVRGNCRGEEFELELATSGGFFSRDDEIEIGGERFGVFERRGEYEVDLTDYDVTSRRGRYRLDENDNLLRLRTGENQYFVVSGEEDGSSVSEGVWFDDLRSALISFKTGRENVEDEPSDRSEHYFEDAISDYEEIADVYASERVEGSENSFYGEEALVRAVGLAETFGEDLTRTRLINKYLELYPNGNYVQSFLTKLDRIDFDTSRAATAIRFDDKDRVIRLLSLDEPENSASAEFSIGTDRLTIERGETEDLIENGRRFGEIRLDEVRPESADVSAFCVETRDGREVLSTNRRRFTLRTNGGRSDICGVDVRLDDTDAEEMARVRITPFAEGTQTLTNFTVAIGIEKRAIELTPDKVEQKIENLNETIEKWGSVNDRIGDVVTGMKTACFATSALLTFKNFATGLSGEAIARQEVMRGENGWTNRCRDMVAQGRYATLDQCFIGEAASIDAEVAATTSALNAVNQKIQAVQNGHLNNNEIFGRSVDTTGVRAELVEQIRADYPDLEIVMGEKKWIDENGVRKDSVGVDELLASPDALSNDALRSIMLNAELQARGISGAHLENVNSQLTETAELVNDNVLLTSKLSKSGVYESEGWGTPISAAGTRQIERAAKPGVLSGTNRARLPGADEEITHTLPLHVVGSVGERQGDPGFETATYIVGLEETDIREGRYSPKTVWKEVGSAGSGTYEVVENPEQFFRTYNIGVVRDTSTLSYSNAISEADKQCRFYETEPYRGMPAVVPFDTREGWYAATRQNLPAFGGIGAFDSSGRVTSFMLCNVGDNGRVEFETGFGDDICQQVNLNTGQPLNVFPGLDTSEARSLVNRASRAIEDAARQHGNSVITVDGERCQVGEPTIGVPGTQCQDFMSPQDCHLLFNVCDPVICPSSRCNLGGQFHVANVPQTGIIGSIFLCLPNIREGIAVPVCLTGIHAGIDGLLSIMRSYQGCLQENLETGEMVGICDQVYSIYLCEFFWNQVAPFVNIIIPKIIEFAYGQGVRGGVEYLSVMSAWQNIDNSVNYFTQQYAVNAVEAFQARSVQEVGTQFCKGFVSAKAPSAFETLVRPDSPPQFHAWFDQKTFSSATVPATAQYKVFFHIFAGDDQGANFNVYLRDPPSGGFYSTNPILGVPRGTGFIPRGEFATETVDFTAPEGYQELCVRINNDEHCGFKQVSSSFAVNFLRDEFVSSELQNTNIQSERECIAGSNNPGFLLTPNIQSGVEEFVSPEVYNRGVVRICSTQNPGSGTDPSRFVDVGQCDDNKVRCWLDQRSVDRALTAGNFGARNETLEVLQERAFDVLQDGDVLVGNDAVDVVDDLQSELEKLRRTTGEKEGGAVALLREVDDVFDKLFFNNHKARALLIRGQVNELVAVELFGREESLRRPEIVVSDTDGESGGESGLFGNFARDFIDELTNIYKLGAEEDGKIVLVHPRNNEESPFSLRDDDVIYVNGDGEETVVGKVVVTEEFTDGFVRVMEGVEEVLGVDYTRLLNAVVENWKNYAEENGIEPEVVSEQSLEVLNEGEQSLEVDDQSVGAAAEELEGVCDVSNARWLLEGRVLNDGEEVVGFREGWTGGEEVTLVVDGNAFCIGREARFEIFEDESWPASDVLLRDDILKVMFDAAGRASVNWNPLWSNDGFLQGEPEYYFWARFDEDGRIAVKSNTIRVSEPTVLLETEVEEISFYGLTDPLGIDGRQNIVIGNNAGTISAYVRNNLIYVVNSDEPVGAVVSSTGRINVPDNALEEVRSAISSATYCHLRFLHNRNFNDLLSGDKIEFVSGNVFDPGLGSNTCESVEYEGFE